MKKKLFTIVMCLCACISVEAQDVIAHRDGNVTMGKVVEIGKTEVKYRTVDNPDGPLYTLCVNDLLSIRLENGVQVVLGQQAISTDIDEEDDAPVGFAFRPEVRMRMVAPLSENVDGGSGFLGVAGVQLNRSIIFGPGCGLTWMRYYNDEAFSLEFPVFLQLRAMVPTQGFSPYFIAQAGYSFGRLHHVKSIIGDDSKRLGYLGVAGVGCRMKLKRGSMFFDLTYQCQQVRSDRFDTPQSVCISGGYFFERRK